MRKILPTTYIDILTTLQKVKEVRIIRNQWHKHKHANEDGNVCVRARTHVTQGKGTQGESNREKAQLPQTTTTTVLLLESPRSWQGNSWVSLSQMISRVNVCIERYLQTNHVYRESHLTDVFSKVNVLSSISWVSWKWASAMTNLFVLWREDSVAEAYSVRSIEQWHVLPWEIKNLPSH